MNRPSDERDYEGLFIVFEGIDGSGTSTQVRLLTEWLRRERRVVYASREPSDGPIGSLIRQALSGRLRWESSLQAPIMALLFAADRLDHVGATILPQVREGAIALSDRYDLSSITYQTATADPQIVGADFEAWVRGLNRHAMRPDLTIVLDVSAERAEQRRCERDGAPELYETGELQQRLAEWYRKAEQLVPGDRLVHLDGEASVEEVAAAVRAAVQPLLVEEQ